MVDAWPVLTAVSFQPNSDGSEGKCQNVEFKTLSCVLVCSLCQVIKGAFLIYSALNAFLIFYFRFVLTHHADREVHT